MFEMVANLNLHLILQIIAHLCYLHLCINVVVRLIFFAVNQSAVISFWQL